jgi:ribosomal protein S18 acetylase RimI-like enzyme
MSQRCGAGMKRTNGRASARGSIPPVSVVVVAGNAVGLLRLDRRKDELFLASVELAPEAQRRGLGAEIVRSVLEEAAQRGVPVRLQVLRHNPARRLYERLGFHVVGETATHIEMVHE